MAPETLFTIIILILIISYTVDQVLDYVNARHFSDPIPTELKDVFDQEEYIKSQLYKKEKYRFAILTSTASLVITLLFFFLDGFAVVDGMARSVAENEIVIALVFFGMIMLGSDILMTPFSYYSTFVIEEKFGFNKTSKTTFFIDKLKGWLMMSVFGGIILAAIVWFYQWTGKNFWLYAWGVIAIFSILLNFFYSRLIVPLFNKQVPLEEGSLRNAIKEYADKVGFHLEKIYVIDGSKRSTKANAYFSGFGREKRVTLYDTLIQDLNEEEIIAVLAHEVGHYKRHHIVFNMILSVLLTGLTLWILSLFIGNPILSEALKVSQPSFHIGLIAFGILYTPISAVTNLLMNYLSRKFEYEADDFAKSTFAGKPLIDALKKLSKTSLSNLTPHPLYVMAHYSHPTLLQRYRNLMK
ncbi:MAG TPA: M48 family metallopeptidase [Flavobacteriaceae bacterium]|nr:M48 family metallopeptidase [Flavobacteriaceae bacterium]